MCRSQCLLALATLYVGLAHSWDIAVGVEDLLIFYNEGTETSTVKLSSRNLTALAYDEVHNVMLYVDKQNNNDAICGINLDSKENTCFIKRTGSNIKSIAFDPPTQTLFYTDTNDKSIKWISVKPGVSNNVNANLLIMLEDRIPIDIAVDSCRGYIYWTNTKNKKKCKGCLERARFNGSEREIIDKDFDKFKLLSLVIDPLTQKIYYSDGRPLAGHSYRHIYLNRADLNGLNKQTIYHNTFGHFSVAKELTVSKDYLYWVNSSKSYNTVWQIPKNTTDDEIPAQISTIHTKKSLAIATNYKIEDQIQGIQDCDALTSLLTPISVTSDSLNIDQTTEYSTEYIPSYTTPEYSTDLAPEYTTPEYSTDLATEYTTPEYSTDLAPEYTTPEYSTDLATEYTTPEYSTDLATEYTTPEYSTDLVPEYIRDYTTRKTKEYTADTEQRCEFSACHNYCLHGNCSLNDEKLPTCSCNDGYTGERCEVNGCYGYCSNNGTCSLNENSEPVCECKGDYLGDRCEVSECLNYCIQGNCSVSDDGLPTCRCNAGYSGKRCEVYACGGYCLNDGNCTLNEVHKPVCQCAGNHEGSRCEAVKTVTITINNTTLPHSTATHYSVRRNLTFDLQSNWRKRSAKVTVIVKRT